MSQIFQKLFFTYSSLFVSICFLLSSCSSPEQQQQLREWMAPGDKIRVLATTAMIGSLVKEVGGERVDLLVLIGEELDPHSYQLVKGDSEKIDRADLIFYNGLNLEHGPSLWSSLQENPKAIPLGNKLYETNQQLFLFFKEQIDPHIWMDISMWASTLPFIIKELQTIDPLHAQEYEANGQAFFNELIKEHQEIKSLLASVPANKRFLVTSHDAFNYFARAYLAEEAELSDGSWQKRFVAPEGLAPDSQLSTADIAAIIDHMQRYSICVLFTESNVSKDSIRKIVKAGQSKGLDLIIASESLYGDAMGAKGSDGDTYIKMLRHNSQLIWSYLTRQPCYVNGQKKAEQQKTDSDH